MTDDLYKIILVARRESLADAVDDLIPEDVDIVEKYIDRFIDYFEGLCQQKKKPR